MNRKELADIILERLTQNEVQLKKMFTESSGDIGYFYLDNLLPVEIAQEIYKSYPPASKMVQKKTIREFKNIAAKMNEYNPLLEEAIYAFQDPRIVAEVVKITGIKTLLPDEHLYAGGISSMSKGHYLNPHIDNSHDKDRKMWRVLNLLYYVSPDWKRENGGNLELWPGGVKNPQITLESLFNRLVVMATHDTSWHSVSPVQVDQTRCCVSNYYFSPDPVRASDTFHVTSFRGRPDQKVIDLMLTGDNLLRKTIRKVFPNGAFKLTHFYKRD